ncbi:two-component system, chemotaxis family, response regulator CheY [Meinhardsimonia xiamenensis]|jgi:two-component system chemotaxis response regulator CheY|uniref:Two-component system, chemotaxis family, response regulator CheY n=2 Tax=Meinhardsimonia xiamenensis TaxID=990712 RepID=A0A1G9D595_9RHOB|nr:response regulator [Meinhardsimonia xiamenensis]PRX38125.1 two-component system chemotaxis response regulator CheY [Meinhardsimonia xiamenensis]SDK59092.1 two-component system, chemotaxis family, response regulator CheY [Meinhardsimonia xiamenensis]
MLRPGHFERAAMALRSELRVLVVDDMSVSRQVLLQLLERFGVRQVRTACSAEEALQLLESAPIDVVICDLCMPGMDGMALLRRMRGDSRHRRKRFVLTTGHAAGVSLGHIPVERPDAVLPKPFEARELLDCMERIAGRI